MQTNIQSKTQQQQIFVPPQTMLQGLLSSLDYSCNCAATESQSQVVEQQLNQEIKGLQGQVNNIRCEIVEVENLLHARDQLYSQLDQLRQEREQIQAEIESHTTSEQTQKVTYSGYRQMNERLRRRIYQVREYIQKMTFENQKIQEGLISNQYVQQQQQLLIRRKEIQAQAQAPVYQGKRFYQTNLETMVGKLHEKQQQAWRRVRRQEEDIERRNMQARSRKTNGFTYYSPKARTYYSPPRQIY